MALLHFFLALLLAPLLPGIINRIKAKFGGRHGRPYLQLYYDLAKLLRKGAVYPATATWIFRAGPVVSLGAVLVALSMLPLGGDKALFSFTGDFLLATYLLAMGRCATIAAALDTGSAFEGMGASREATFAAMAEPILLLALLPLGAVAGSFSLSAMLSPAATDWFVHWPTLLLLCVAFFIVLLVENCRIPVDDPATHLELTMIHEVMILDHGGVDLAFIEYAAALKLWFFSVLVSGTLLPVFDKPYMALGASLLGILGTIIIIAIVESIMARLRLMRVPHLLALAGTLAALGCILCIR